MNQLTIPKATLGRLPTYLQYLRTLNPQLEPTISAAAVARALSLGEVQVRKDLACIGAGGKPKIGYITKELCRQLEQVLGYNEPSFAILIGAGKLGRALLNYEGLHEYGLQITAAFDSDPKQCGQKEAGCPIYPMEQLEDYCRTHPVQIGIITVPGSAAQSVCNQLIRNHINAIWSFAPGHLQVPEGTVLQQENMALAVAHLNHLRHKARQ